MTNKKLFSTISRSICNIQEKHLDTVIKRQWTNLLMFFEWIFSFENDNDCIIQVFIL